jgi:hypothetical protein
MLLLRRPPPVSLGDTNWVVHSLEWLRAWNGDLVIYCRILMTSTPLARSPIGAPCGWRAVRLRVMLQVKGNTVRKLLV